MNQISGKNINLRLIETNDAEFVVNLRRRYGTYLSYTEDNVQRQIKWIECYKKRELEDLEYYFIITNKKFQPIGTIRIYNIDKKSFTFGSFIVDKNQQIRLAALEAITLMFDYAFSKLNLDKCFFDCRKDNMSANNFYNRYGADKVGETDLDFLYKYHKDNFIKNSKKYYDSIKND